eukprot:1178236-Prorocentrum_minimum.AAC.3
MGQTANGEEGRNRWSGRATTGAVCGTVRMACPSVMLRCYSHLCPPLHAGGGHIDGGPCWHVVRKHAPRECLQWAAGGILRAEPKSVLRFSRQPLAMLTETHSALPQPRHPVHLGQQNHI